MRILLVCGVGASSGFIAQQMRRAAKAQKIEASIIARSESELLDAIKEADVLLIGPHLAFQEESIKAAIAPFGVPYGFIPEEIYGSLDGAGALEFAQELLENN